MSDPRIGNGTDERMFEWWLGETEESNVISSRDFSVLLYDATSNQEHLRDVAGFSDSLIVTARRLNTFHGLESQEIALARFAMTQ